MNVAKLEQVTLCYGTQLALANITLALPAGKMIGLIGPDGVGKSSLLGLLAGAKALQQGQVAVLGGDMRSKAHRDAICPHIAYMPQGLGKNLYPTLSVEENLQFFGRLFGHDAAERRRRIDDLTQATGLYKFLQRPAGKLSGGMKQKLGLCCALIHDPQFLILDEPTTGVDPLARSQFWQLIKRIKQSNPQMSVIVATAYMDEAAAFDWLVAMDDGQVLATGTPAELLASTGTTLLEDAFIQLLPAEKKQGYAPVSIPPLPEDITDIAIEAQGLTMRFGDFTAVDNVSFRIRRGEIFGFLGSNGCGKSTTMKMLTGLIPATAGKAWLFGQEVDPKDINTRKRVGYMSQAFSLYSELTVLQNLVLHARLFHVAPELIEPRVTEMLTRFDLTTVQDELPDNLPLGLRQRLSLAVAMVHKPELLILDEPTSGVDPVARDNFWRLLVALSREDQVTIFISTHFMNEAERCDRMSMMHAGKVLDSDKPAALVEKSGCSSLEAAFIDYLVKAAGPETSSDKTLAFDSSANAEATPKAPVEQRFSWQRMLSYMWREAIELRRDPVRSTLGLLGSLILLFVMGFGISLDVEDLRYAVLDRDKTLLSQSYTQSLSGSRYFIEQPPVSDYAELDQRMRSGELALVLELPPGFARDIERGKAVAVGAWVDGAMPRRTEMVKGYVQGIHLHWLQQQVRQHSPYQRNALASIETRYRYNPDVKSLPAMVPAILPLLLLMMPAMLTALAVVREKELGSILNLYVTPVTKVEFLLGKQLPYIAFAMMNFFLMCLLAVTVFGVPITGSFATLTLAALCYAFIATSIGLVASTITRSQIAAMFFAILATMIPAIQFSGLLDPVSSMEGGARWIGEIYPATYMITISRGIFSKGLSLQDLYQSFIPLLLAIPVIFFAAVLLLKKQER